MFGEQFENEVNNKEMSTIHQDHAHINSLKLNKISINVSHRKCLHSSPASKIL